MFNALLSWDWNAWLAIQREWQHPLLRFFFDFIANAGFFAVPLVLAAVALLWRGAPRWRLAVFYALLSVGLADAAGLVSKKITDRERPQARYERLQAEQAGKPDPEERGSSSFPSNHAANSMAVALILGAQLVADGRRRWAVLLFSFAILVGFSRVYMGRHYPLDVLGGLLLGGACAIGIQWLRANFNPVSFTSDAEASQGWRCWRAVQLNWTGVAILLVGLVFIYLVTIIARGEYNLAGEEAQYWDWSRRLAWGYYSKPPLIAWLINISCAIFGQNELGVRFTAIGLSIALAAISWRFAMRLFDDARVALAVLLSFVLMPLFGTGMVIITTDTPLLLCWAGCCWLLYEALVMERRRAWLGAALFFGFGLLAKYAMIYIVPCLAVFFWLSPPHRRWLRHTEPWLFLLIGVALFSPFLAWNAARGWISFRHVVGQATAHQGLRINPGALFSYLGEQAGVVTPLLFGLLVWAAWRVWRGRCTAAPRELFLWSLGVPVYLGLLIKSLQAEVLANWAAPAYYTWMLLAIGMFDEWLRGAVPRARRNGVRYAWATGVMLLAAFFFLRERGVYDGLAKGLRTVGVKLNPKSDPAYRLTGSDKLGAWVGKELARMPQPDRTFIFSHNYQVAALLAFYVPGQPRVFTVNTGERRMSQYDLWGPPDAAQAGWDAFYVTWGDADKLSSRYAPHFTRAAEPWHLDATRRNIKYQRSSLIRCYGFDGRFENAIQYQQPPVGGGKF